MEDFKRESSGNKLTVYLSHPITGLPWETVMTRFSSIKQNLEDIGYSVLLPVRPHEALSEKKNIDSASYLLIDKPIELTSSYHLRTDFWLVTMADILLVVHEEPYTNGQVSIGCVVEMAWAYAKNKHIILVCNNTLHTFLESMATIKLETLKDAYVYLEELKYGIMQ